MKTLEAGDVVNVVSLSDTLREVLPHFQFCRWDREIRHDSVRVEDEDSISDLKFS